jgi:guanosine-3',5'-bis(diphosphate) 3'-pyrophosphohydrolase
MKEIIKAARFAAEKHQHQRRKNADATPYINHPLEVAELLVVDGGVTDQEVIIAALLHDTIEDTQTTKEDIESLSGPAVRDYVLEVTDDENLSKGDQIRSIIERAPRLSNGAKLIKLADKIANLRAVSNDPPSNWPVRLQKRFFDQAFRVFEGLRGCNKTLEDLFLGIYEEGLKNIEKRGETSKKAL